MWHAYGFSSMWNLDLAYFCLLDSLLLKKWWGINNENKMWNATCIWFFTSVKYAFGLFWDLIEFAIDKKWRGRKTDYNMCNAACTWFFTNVKSIFGIFWVIRQFAVEKSKKKCLKNAQREKEKNYNFLQFTIFHIVKSTISHLQYNFTMQLDAGTALLVTRTLIADLP